MTKGTYAFMYDDEIWGDYVTPAESDRLAALACKEGESRFPGLKFIPTRGESYPPPIIQSDDVSWALSLASIVGLWVYGDCDPWEDPDMVWDLREIYELGNEYYGHYGNKSVYRIPGDVSIQSVMQHTRVKTPALGIKQAIEVLNTANIMYNAEMDNLDKNTLVSQICPF